MILIQQSDWESMKAHLSNLFAKHLPLVKKQEPFPWIPEKEVIELLSISKSTLRNYRLRGLPFTKVGKQNLYRREDLNEFLTKNYNGDEYSAK